MIQSLLLLVIAVYVKANIKEKDCRDAKGYSSDSRVNERERERIKLLLFNDVESKKYVCRLESEAARIRNALNGTNYDKKVLQKSAERELLIKPKTDLNVIVVTESKLQDVDSLASAAGCASGESKHLEQPETTTRTTTTTTTTKPRPQIPTRKKPKKAKGKSKKKGRKQTKKKATQKKNKKKPKTPVRISKPVVVSKPKIESKIEVQQSPKVVVMKYYVCVYKSRVPLNKTEPKTAYWVKNVVF